MGKGDDGEFVSIHRNPSGNELRRTEPINNGHVQLEKGLSTALRDHIAAYRRLRRRSPIVRRRRIVAISRSATFRRDALYYY